MKKTIFLTIVLLLCVLFVTHAQTAGQALIQEDEEESFTERVEEGVRPKTPGRMTLFGELYARGWIGGHNADKSKYVQGADLQGSDTYFGMLWEFTNFTGAAFKFKVNPEKNGMNAYFDNAYVYSDIAGELGSRDLVARLSLGRFGFDSAFLSPVDPMNTGDDIQHDQSMDTFNWKLELGTKGDLYPILFLIASDLDFGYQGSGYSTMNNYNNRGASGMFEVRSENYQLSDTATLSWNVYYMGRFFPNANSSTKPGEVTNKTQHSMGGTMGVVLGIAEGQSLKMGAGAEYNTWSYGGHMETSGNLKGKTIQSLDWQAGVGYVMANMFAVALGFRQDGYSHAQWAVAHNVKPLTDMHAALTLQYLGLMESAKMSLYAGFAYATGTLYYSNQYKTAWAKDGKVYSTNDVNGYVAGNPISIDVGIGYHPVSNAKIFFGYNYGTWGMEAPDYAFRDTKGSWGKIYLKGAYTW